VAIAAASSERLEQTPGSDSNTRGNRRSQQSCAPRDDEVFKVHVPHQSKVTVHGYMECPALLPAAQNATQSAQPAHSNNRPLRQ
jgi:hypothetical protein